MMEDTVRNSTHVLNVGVNTTSKNEQNASVFSPKYYLHGSTFFSYSSKKCYKPKCGIDTYL